MSVMIIGDLHLGKGQSIGKPGGKGQFNSRILDQFQLLNWLFETAVAQEVTDLVLTGDVFEESKPDYFLMEKFLSWLFQCQSQGFNVHVILGNHDLERDGSQLRSPLDLIDTIKYYNVHFYKEMSSIRIGDLGLTFLPFRDLRSYQSRSQQEVLQLLAEELETQQTALVAAKTKIAIGHLAIEGSIPIGDEFDDTLNEIMCPVSLFQNYDYTWMGHVHRPQVKSKKPYVAHVGSLDLSDFGETDHHKIIVVFKDNQFQELKVPSRPLKRIRLEVSGQTDTTQELLQEIDNIRDLSDSLMKIEIKINGQEALPVNRKRIEAALKDRGIFHLAKLTETRSVSPLLNTDKEIMDPELALKPREAIRAFAKLKDFQGAELSEFLEACDLIVDEVQK